MTNPGSTEARRQGCICPVLDNNHGLFAPWPPDGWWINESCPVHQNTTEGGAPTPIPIDRKSNPTKKGPSNQ